MSHFIFDERFIKTTQFNHDVDMAASNILNKFNIYAQVKMCFYSPK